MPESASIFIAAPPEVVYATVSDITRMGEYSPECYSCEWVEGASDASVGAKFLGRNKSGLIKWKTTCRVIDATPGSEFAFTVVGKNSDSTVWRYAIASADGGTTLTESCEAPPSGNSTLEKAYTTILFGGETKRSAKRIAGMQTTLARIKAVIEK